VSKEFIRLQILWKWKMWSLQKEKTLVNNATSSAYAHGLERDVAGKKDPNEKTCTNGPNRRINNRIVILQADSKS